MRKQQAIARRVRVRSKSLAQVDETKLTLAIWLLAKQIVAEQVELETVDDADAAADRPRGAA